MDMGSEQRNLATTQSIYEAFGKGDMGAILAQVSDAARWEAWEDNRAQQAGVPWLAPRSGKAGAQAFFEVVGGGFEIRDFRVFSMMAGGNQVAAEFTIEFEVPATGRRCRDEEIHLWTLNDDGQVTRLRHYTDTAKHIATAAE